MADERNDLPESSHAQGGVSDNVEASTDAQEPRPIAASIDEELLLSDPGGSAGDSPMSIDEELSIELRGSDGGQVQSTPGFVGDLVEWQLGSSIYDYSQENDVDGNVVLGGGGVAGVWRADTTSGSFGDPVSNNHTGAAADGQFYYDGQPTSLGNFGTLAGGFNDLSWQRWQTPSGPLDPVMEAGDYPVVVADDTVRLENSSGAGTAWITTGLLTTSHRWRIQGDFDVRMDFSDWVNGKQGLWMQLTASADTWVRVGRTYFSSDAYERATMTGGTFANQVFVAETVLAGKLRMTRTGSSCQAYYWNGSTWTVIGGAVAAPMGTDDVWVEIVFSHDDNTTGRVDVSNFTLATGNTTNLASWAREPFSANRGNLDSMPDDMAVVGTADSVDLIDTDTDLLWMRFDKGTDNALHSYNSGCTVHDVSWCNGVLAIAYATGASSNEGGGILVDFATDQIRIARQDSSAITGGYYAERSVAGTIGLRNDGLGYSDNDTVWRIQTYRVLSCALYEDGSKIYAAWGTSAGLTIIETDRYNDIWTLGVGQRVASSTTGEVTKCSFDRSNGNLFYLDSGGVRYTTKATWVAGLGGSFTPNSSLALPGTRNLLTQEIYASNGALVFVPSNEGVYKSTWPAAFTLHYGEQGSGAAYEILPNYERITIIGLARDGSEDILVCGLEIRLATGQVRNQLVAIKLSTNQVYGKAPVESTFKAVTAL